MSIIIYFVVELIRRWRKYFYTPIYFPFVFETLNPRFAAFYGTNTLYSNVISDVEAEKLEREIIRNAAISALLSGFIIPITLGYFLAVVVTLNEFTFHLLL